MSYIKGSDRHQITLFPEVIDDYITEDNEVRVIEAYVNSLDLNKLGFTKATLKPTGRPPYDPRDLLKLYLYGYLNRIRSSRRLEDEAKRNIEVIWLLQKLKPDFKTIADFRKDNKKALKNIFRDFNQLLAKWDLFGKELIAIDSSKFRAQNSKKNNFNQKKLDKKLKEIDQKIDRYLEEMDEEDEKEKDVRKVSKEEIEQRIKELQQRKMKYESYQRKLQEDNKKEISTTDPDARLMSNNNNGVEVSYNVQTTVDAKNKLILDFKVTSHPNDLGELDNMALRAKKLFQGKSFTLLADKGYYKKEDLKRCLKEKITPYVAKQSYASKTGQKEFYPENFIYDQEKDIYLCPQQKELFPFRKREEKGKLLGYDYKNEKACQECKYLSQCTKSKKGRSIYRSIDQDILDSLEEQRKLNYDQYRMRQMIIEHPFGTIKRSWEASYFLTKRKVGVTSEMALTYLAYNLKRAVKILGVKEMIKRLKEEIRKREPVLS